MNLYQLANSILPPEKRSTTIKAFINAMLSPLQWLSNAFDLYLNDANIADYVAGTYNYLDEVRYNHKIYVSLVANNTSLPTDTNSWYCYQVNWVGVNDRKNIYGNKLVLEYAINKYFGLQLPVDPTNGDIYIVNNQSSNTFVVALTEPYSSTVGLTTSDDLVGESSVSFFSYMMTVYAPNGIISELEIRSFIDKYLSFSITYNVIFY